MAGLAHVRVVAATALRLWLREVATLAGVGVRAVKAGAAAAVLAAVAVGLLLALVASLQFDVVIDPALRTVVSRTSFAAAAMSAGVVAVVLCVSVPPRTALQSLLDLLPIGRGAARAGQLVPVLVMGFVFSIAITSTTVLVMCRMSPGGWELARGIGVYVLLMVSTLLLVVGIYTALRSAAIRAVRLPAHHSAMSAAAISLALVLAATVPDILFGGPRDHPVWGVGEMTPSRAFAWVAAAPSAWSLLTVAGWVVVAVVVFGVGVCTETSESPPLAYRLLRGTRPMPRTPWSGQLWAETLIAVRNPQYVMTAVLMPAGVCAVLALSRVAVAAPIVPALAAALPIVPFMLAMYAVGRTLRSHWVGMLCTGRPLWWMAPKPLAYAGVAVALATAVAGAETALGLLGVGDLPGIAAKCVLAFSVALAGGALVPYSEQQPLSVTAGAFVVGVAYLATSLVLGLVSGRVSAALSLVVVVAAAVPFLGVYALVARRHAVRGLSHARAA